MRNLRYNYFCKIEIGFKISTINFNISGTVRYSKVALQKLQSHLSLYMYQQR